MILRLSKSHSLEMNPHTFLTRLITILSPKERAIFKGGGVRSNPFIFHEGHIIFFFTSSMMGPSLRVV